MFAVEVRRLVPAYEADEDIHGPQRSWLHFEHLRSFGLRVRVGRSIPLLTIHLQKWFFRLRIAQTRLTI